MESGARAGLRAADGEGEGGGWMLVEARLQGGAPWGFTLQGGLEHGEALVISKVEQGGKANRLEQPLLVRDELIVINDVELSGYRQEAIALIKGSYKSLELTVRRGFNPGNMEDFVTATNCLPVLPLSSPLSFQLPPSSPPLQPTFHSSNHSWGSASHLIINNGHREPSSRPHSWHSTKIGEGQQDQGAMDTMNNAWPQSYHSSVSTADLCGGFDSSGSYLRKSPDQYSSRGSMESLDPPPSSQLHSAAQHHHPLEHRANIGYHPAYSCHQLSSARSSNSIDHPHSKRDSAYSSFSTSSSIPDYLASNPCFRTERSYSMETVPQRGGGSAEMLQADIRHARTPYDIQHGGSQDRELSSASTGLLTSSNSRGRVRTGPSGVVCYRGTSSGKTSCRNSSGTSVSNRHSVGPIWGSTSRHSSYESLKGAPAPPRRSDSYTAIKNHDRPNSWSSLENVRSLRSQQKGSWHHSSSSVASGKGSYGIEGQLHTVIEKSPESSPTTKPPARWGVPPAPFLLWKLLARGSGVPAPDPADHTGKLKEGKQMDRLGLKSVQITMALQRLAGSSLSGLEPQRPGQRQRKPLTRLELALAEVQRCSSPDHVLSAKNHNVNVNDSAHGCAHSLSVLEKVSCFERRERSEKQRGQSAHLRMTEKGRGGPCGTDDLRNMLERSTKGIKAHRTMSYRGGSSEYMKHRTPADPSSALQRSRSTFQLDSSRPRDFPWRQDIQDMNDPLHDMSSNRQSDLKPTPSNAPLTVSSSSSHQQSTVPTKYFSQEKKGPQTMPKPQGILVTPRSLTSLPSPHTPKERHVISPDVRGPSPPALPSVPPVGAAPLIRICGRKRLTADQKKRSYSEPENMNKVGVSGSEALFQCGGETSVADRRRMFELAVSHAGGRAPQSAISRPELRQAQQDALADYVDRKRGVKREGGEQRSGSRPHSAHQHHEHGSHTDSLSMSSASSQLSLQDSAPDQIERSFYPTVPPGADINSLQSSFFYPGRVTSQRPPARPAPSASPGFTVERAQIPHLPPEADIRKQSPAHQHPQQARETQLARGVSEEHDVVLQRTASSRRPQKSASAEDLLAYKDGPTSSQHYWSHASATAEKLNQGFLPEDIRMVDVLFPESGGCANAADCPVSSHMSGDLVSPVPSQCTHSVTQLEQSAQDYCHTPVTRRERQKNGERQRANSTSALAASVGLPCDFSPLMTAERGTAEWKASERLSQANLDAITFPDIPQTGPADDDAAAAGAPGNRKSVTMDGQSRDSSTSDDTKKETGRSRVSSSEMRERHSPEKAKLGTSALLPHGETFSPNRESDERAPSSPSSRSSVHRHLSSLRISESSLLGSLDQQHPLETVPRFPPEDFDEVFLQNNNCKPFPETHETNITEDFPPPPPPLKQDTQQQPQPSSVTAFTTEHNLGFEYQLLPKREKTSEELRAEDLAHQLVLQDPSLASFLDTWGSKSIVELMEEMFPNSRLTGTSGWQRRGSVQVEDRVQPGVRNPAQTVTDQRRKETDLDEEEKDLNIRKVELCEALRSSVAALERDKQALCEEQSSHQALGGSIELLVQERLKTNERDKYIMFIGDLEKIVNLLLSLCSRLARINRSLLALEKDKTMMSQEAKEERDSLHHKRLQLLRQTEDARELKENLDRRQRVVHAILSSYLTAEQLQDYCRFVGTKPSLLIRQRHLDELIRHGGEQLRRLAESLPAEVTEAHSWLKACRLSNPTLCFSLFSSLVPPSVTPAATQPLRSASVTPL
ncbi:protein Shroom3 [Cololabis saira]|uniref:protein Shroom3 n=1 Tax=Cololabis saira TaxID=129043 RepID=UPI002AD507EC|nr:protein Shroom3 [Cololabis saira]